MKYLLAEIRSTLGKCRKFAPENIFACLLIVHISVHNILSLQVMKKYL